jgi:hypothetical protein
MGLAPKGTGAGCSGLNLVPARPGPTDRSDNLQTLTHHDRHARTPPSARSTLSSHLRRAVRLPAGSFRLCLWVSPPMPNMTQHQPTSLGPSTSSPANLAVHGQQHQQYHQQQVQQQQPRQRPPPPASISSSISSSSGGAGGRAHRAVSFTPEATRPTAGTAVSLTLSWTPLHIDRVAYSCRQRVHGRATSSLSCDDAVHLLRNPALWDPSRITR